MKFSYTVDKEKEFRKTRALAKKHRLGPSDHPYSDWATVDVDGSELQIYKHVYPGHNGGHFEVDDGNANVIWGKTPIQAVRNWIKTYGSCQ